LVVGYFDPFHSPFWLFPRLMKSYAFIIITARWHHCKAGRYPLARQVVLSLCATNPGL
jgi:hypothetical protein